METPFSINGRYLFSLTEKDCPRCGMPKGYHKEKIFKCVRSKPYKTRDRAEVRIGMQLWSCHPYDCEEIKTGVVRFVSPGGYVELWKIPPQDMQEPFPWSYRIAHDGHFDLSFMCFASEENAKKFQTKCLENKKKYMNA